MNELEKGKVVLGRSCIVIPYQSVKDKSIVDVNKILNKDFMLRYVCGKFKTEKKLKMFKSFDNKYFSVPKSTYTLCLSLGLIDIEKIYISSYESEDDYFPPEPDLFDNQIITCEYIYENYFNIPMPRSVFLIAPTGEGKTRIMLGLFHKVGGKMLIIVPNEALLKQTIDEAERTYEGCKVTSYYGKVKDLSGNIVVGIINTMLMQLPGFFDIFTLVAFDEAPDYCSENFSDIFWKAQTKYTIAVTATPEDRTDGFDKMLLFHFGAELYMKNIKGVDIVNELFRYEFNILYYNGPKEYTEVLVKNGIVSSSMTIDQLNADPYRLIMIIARIKQHYYNQRNVLVFCERRSYCELITRILMRLDSKINYIANETFIIMGGVTREQLSMAYDTDLESSIIVTTYNYFRRGISIPRMDTIILANPRKTGLTQIIGRISRRGGDMSKVRIVDDIVDNRSTLKNQLTSRKEAYRLKTGCIHEYKNLEYNNLKVSNPDLYDLIVEELAKGISE